MSNEKTQCTCYHDSGDAECMENPCYEIAVCDWHKSLEATNEQITSQMEALYLASRTLAHQCKELEATNERLTQELQRVKAIKADACECGHGLISHRGHCHVVGTPESTHCAQCGCLRFSPPSLIAEIERLTFELTAAADEHQVQSETIGKYQAENKRLTQELEQLRRSISVHTESCPTCLKLSEALTQATLALGAVCPYCLPMAQKVITEVSKIKQGEQK